MKIAPSLILGIAACGVIASTLLAASGPTSTTPTFQQTTATPDPAAGLFTRMCSECHDSKRIVDMRRTTTEWEDVLKKMIQEGAVGTEKDFETVFEYLRRNYGKVYINRATADEIGLIVGLTSKDAEAIVAYRKANGDFADFDAVKKVPGVDLKKLDEHKDAIAF